MAAVFQAGHQRTCSQAQHLIPKSFGDEDGGSTSAASPYDAKLVECSSRHSPLPHSQPPLPSSTATVTDANAMRFSTLSECSSYYGLPGTFTENETRYFCKNPYLRANVRVVIGSLVLTLVGAALLIFGLFVMIVPNEMDIHGWIFLVVGVLFFIPGVYHVTFILCVLCNRPGYSFDNLPTFSKPQL